MMSRIIEILKILEIEAIPEELFRVAKEAYSSKKFDQLFCLVGSQARIWLFIELEDEMDDTTYFRYLGKILTFTYVSFDPDLFKYLLNPRRRDLTLRNSMMSKEELDTFTQLPSEVTIFRGNVEGKEAGFSWSLSKDVALPFARRHFPHPGQLLMGTCLKSKIIAYFSREEEIFIDPRDVAIHTKESVEAGERINTFRINGHDLVWHHMKKSASYKKIKNAAKRGSVRNDA
jgi:hypothetical protein